MDALTISIWIGQAKVSHEQKLWDKNCIKDLCEEKVAAAGLQFYNFTTLFSWSSFSSIFSLHAL